MTTELTEGRWLVKTAASSYLIDMDERWLQRNPGEGALVDEGYYIVNKLRGDGERIPLRADAVIAVDFGVSSVFYIDHPTRWKQTTPVQSWERVEK